MTMPDREPPGRPAADPGPGTASGPRRPALLRDRWWLAGLLVSCLVVVLLAPLASADPDGLERVAEDQGFIEQAQAALYELLPDYSIPGIEDPALSTVLSGLLGVLLVFGIVWLLARVLVRRGHAGRP
jgi:ABC-type Fe3+ transport system permease subunit